MPTQASFHAASTLVTAGVVEGAFGVFGEGLVVTALIFVDGAGFVGVEGGFGGSVALDFAGEGLVGFGPGGHADEVALHEVAAQHAQSAQLVGGRDPLGDDLHVECVRELHDGPHDRVVVAADAEAPCFTTVELQHVGFAGAQGVE